MPIQKELSIMFLINTLKIKSMKNYILSVILMSVVVFFYACSSEPKPITYGDDKCDYCTMNIMDKPYGTELVTDKGKVYKFDSTECLLNYMKENNHAEYAHILTNTMDKPAELIDANICTFLISEKLPSPMGENITAFSNEAEAKKAHKEYGGELFNFDKLKELKMGKQSPNHHHMH